MSAASTWVVPGAPLRDGAGWRIWYSKPGSSGFSPEPVRVTIGGRPVAVQDAEVELLPPVAGVDRRMAVSKVRLAKPDPEGGEYRIDVPESGTHTWRTMPAGLDHPVTFFVSSCFWRDNDKEGAYGAGMRELTKLHRPAFKMLIGDQVYQDWPPARVSSKSAARQYAERYATYWGDPAYREVLTSSPNLFLCDDHEFWNDYPERQLHLARTWKRRDEFGREALELYRLYQQSANGGPSAWDSFKIGPVGVFMTDTRSERSLFGDKNHHFMTATQWADLENWFAGLDGPGLLVLGQPLFQKDGDWKDHSLSNFAGDYGRLCNLIARTVKGVTPDGRKKAPHDVMIITGDIHRGRFSSATFPGMGDGRVCEFVASPASRVGPYISTPDPEPPPSLLRPLIGGVQARWEVLEDAGKWTPMIDNNVGVVRMSAGTAGRVRFELSIWRHRPYDDRSFWKRVVKGDQPQGPILPLYRKEIELR